MTTQSVEETDAMNATVRPARRRRGALATLTAVAAVALTACAGTGDLASYDLPAESARYTFEAETDGVTTRWEYVSDKPSEDDAPERNPCVGEVVDGDKAACRPEPLIFLRYDLGLDLVNTAEAGGSHPITITAYYQDRLTAPPKVTTMKVEATYDGGRTWHRASTRAAGTNTFTSKIKHPGRARAAQGVGLRINASDTKGDTVTQTLPTAYKLR